MRPLAKGLIVALVHLLLVSSLGAKLLYDRSTRPRVWVRAAPYDPDMPIRGRYVALQLRVETRGFAGESRFPWYGENAALKVEDDRLIAEPSDVYTGVSIYFPSRSDLNRGTAPERLGILGYDEIGLFYREHLGVEHGIGIRSIDESGAAAKAGLRAGDVVLRVNTAPMDSEFKFGDALERATAIDAAGRISFAVMRGHDTLTIAVPWQPLPDRDDETMRVGTITPWTPFFIPEHIPDPSVREEGEELWVEVTVPRKGPPRPIRLGVKKEGSDGIVPLDLE